MKSTGCVFQGWLEKVGELVCGRVCIEAGG